MSFWVHAQADPDRVAVIDPRGATLTYGQLYAEVNRLSHGLRTVAGLREGDTLACVMTNGIPMIAVYLAAMQTGLYLVTLNYHSTAAEISYILDDSGAKAVVASARVADAVMAAAAGRVDADRVFVSDRDLGTGTFARLLAGQSAQAPDHRPAGSVMQYTSGTTGRPKGVKRRLSGADADTAAATYKWLFVDEFGFRPGASGRWMVAAPMYHSANITLASAALHLGQTLVIMDGWSPELFCELVQRYRITATHLVPTQFQRLLRMPDRDRYDMSSLEFVLHGAAPCPVDVKRAMFDWLGPVIYEYYGSTEVGTTIARPHEWLAHPGTVGRPSSISELAILDSDGNPVPTGTVGTVYMRQGDDQMEYHNDPVKSAAARRGRLVTVGDLGYVDEDGFLYLVGRSIDLVIVGGVNVYPAEVEAVLLGHPDVADVAVVGRPDDDLGEVVVAYVEPAPGVSAGDELTERLLAYARERLNRQKVPVAVFYVDKMPRDPNGKLYKARLPGVTATGSGPRVSAAPHAR